MATGWGKYKDALAQPMSPAQQQLVNDTKAAIQALQPQETGPSLAGALAALPLVEEARPTNRGATYLARQDRRIGTLEYEVGLLKQRQ